MTREEAIGKLRELHSADADEALRRDVEGDHVTADEVLCDLLKALGYEDVVAEWEKVDKWYA